MNFLQFPRSGGTPAAFLYEAKLKKASEEIRGKRGGPPLSSELFKCHLPPPVACRRRERERKRSERFVDLLKDTDKENHGSCTES